MKAGGGLVGFLARLRGNCVGAVAVLIPAVMEELDETHAALAQAAREQAVVGEGAGLPYVLAVECEVPGLLQTKSVSSGTEICIR